nr:uncharacterized protein LOC100175089 isoform X2 [Ciona intestinalis]|eukprot:XP_009858021.2 uncharacterized protein LOC100175089 isoform X2 [Ciona intestinalis]
MESRSKKKRRSSILKKSPHRKSLVNPDVVATQVNNEEEKRGLSRRVSFANTYQIKEISRVADIAEKWPDSTSDIDTTKIGDISKLSAQHSLTGLNALLSAPLLNQANPNTPKQTNESCPASTTIDPVAKITSSNEVAPSPNQKNEEIIIPSFLKGFTDDGQISENKTQLSNSSEFSINTEVPAIPTFLQTIQDTGILKENDQNPAQVQVKTPTFLLNADSNASIPSQSEENTNNSNKTINCNEDMDITMIKTSSLPQKSLYVDMSFQNELCKENEKTTYDDLDMELTKITGKYFAAQSIGNGPLKRSELIPSDDMEMTCNFKTSVSGVTSTNMDSKQSEHRSDDDMEMTCHLKTVASTSNKILKQSNIVSDDMEITCNLKTEVASSTKEKSVLSNEDMEMTCHKLNNVSHQLTTVVTDPNINSSCNGGQKSDDSMELTCHTLHNKHRVHLPLPSQTSATAFSFNVSQSDSVSKGTDNLADNEMEFTCKLKPTTHSFPAQCDLSENDMEYTCNDFVKFQNKNVGIESLEIGGGKTSMAKALPEKSNAVTEGSTVTCPDKTNDVGCLNTSDMQVTCVQTFHKPPTNSADSESNSNVNKPISTKDISQSTITSSSDMPCQSTIPLTTVEQNVKANAREIINDKIELDNLCSNPQDGVVESSSTNPIDGLGFSNNKVSLKTVFAASAVSSTEVELQACTSGSSILVENKIPLSELETDVDLIEIENEKFATEVVIDDFEPKLLQDEVQEATMDVMLSKVDSGPSIRSKLSRARSSIALYRRRMSSTSSSDNQDSSDSSLSSPGVVKDTEHSIHEGEHVLPQDKSETDCYLNISNRTEETAPVEDKAGVDVCSFQRKRSFDKAEMGSENSSDVLPKQIKLNESNEEFINSEDNINYGKESDLLTIASIPLPMTDTLDDVNEFSSLDIDEFLNRYTDIKITDSKMNSGRESVFDHGPSEPPQSVGELTTSIFMHAKNLPIYSEFISSLTKKVESIQDELKLQKSEISKNNPEIMNAIRFGPVDQSKRLKEKVEQIAEWSKRLAHAQWQVTKSKLHKSLTVSMNMTLDDDIQPIVDQIAEFGKPTELLEKVAQDIDDENSLLEKQAMEVSEMGNPPSDEQVEQYLAGKEKIEKLQSQLSASVEIKERNVRCEKTWHDKSKLLWQAVQNKLDSEREGREKIKAKKVKSQELDFNKSLVPWRLVADDETMKVFSFLRGSLLLRFNTNNLGRVVSCNIESKLEDQGIPFAASDVEIFKFIHGLIQRRYEEKTYLQMSPRTAKINKALHKFSSEACAGNRLYRDIIDLTMDYEHCQVEIHNDKLNVGFGGFSPNLCSFSVDFFFTKDGRSELRPISYSYVDSAANFGIFSQKKVESVLDKIPQDFHYLSMMKKALVDMIRTEQ